MDLLDVETPCASVDELSHPQIVEHTHMREYLPSLRDITYTAARPLMRALACYVIALEADDSAPGPQQSDNRLHQRALADPIATQNTDNLTAMDPYANASQDVSGGVTRAKILNVKDCDHVSLVPNKFLELRRGQ